MNQSKKQELAKAIKSNIVLLSNQKGISQRQLAMKTGYTVAGFHRALLKGTLKIDTLTEISEILNVSIGDIIGFQSKNAVNIKTSDTFILCVQQPEIDPSLHQMD